MKGVWETVRYFLNLHVKLKQNVVIAYKPQLPAPSYGKFGGSLTTMFPFILFLCFALGSLGFFPFRCLLVLFSVFSLSLSLYEEVDEAQKKIIRKRSFSHRAAQQRFKHHLK